MQFRLVKSPKIIKVHIYHLDKDFRQEKNRVCSCIFFVISKFVSFPSTLKLVIDFPENLDEIYHFLPKIYNN